MKKKKRFDLQNTFPLMTTLGNRVKRYMSRLMGKPTICKGENKDADQLRGYTAKLISVFVFATRIVQFLFYLNQKFQDSSSFLRQYRLICVGPGRKPHCWFSNEVAHIYPSSTMHISLSNAFICQVQICILE